MSTPVNVTIFQLLESPAVVALVGRDINPDRHQGGNPSINISSTSDTPINGLASTTGSGEARVTISIRGTDTDLVEKIGDAVVEGLHFVHGRQKDRPCFWAKAGPDMSRWGDDSSTLERVIDFHLSYGRKGS